MAARCRSTTCSTSTRRGGWLAEFSEPAAVIVKHNNPCGVAVADDVAEAYGKALACDPLSAFGGVIALNRPVTVGLAERLHENFIEVLIAPGYDEGALDVLRQKESVRILEDTERRGYAPQEPEIKKVRGGMLVQEVDVISESRESMEVATEAAPTEEQWADLLFAWKVCRHVRSNAIVFAHDGATVGIGAGQMSRVDSVRIAVTKAQEARGEEAAAVLSRVGGRLGCVLPVPRRPADGDGRRCERVHPAGRLGARRRGRGRLRRGGRRDGLHRPPPLPPLGRRCPARASTPASRSSGCSAPTTARAATRSECSSTGRRCRRASARPLPRSSGSRRPCSSMTLERGEMRIFTPATELPLAGHPLVGTAWLMRERGTEPTVLRPPAGEVAVRFEGGLTYARARPEWCPPFEWLQLESPEAVDALAGAPEGYGFVGAWSWLDEEEGLVRARVFVPAEGIAEDEATGSAAILLCAQLGRELEIRQGRGSVIHAIPAGDGQAEIAGRVVLER